MSVSTNGQICYGIVFEEGFEFPWDSDEFDGDIDEWWKSVCGYKNPKFNPYTPAGELKDGIKEDDHRIKEWFAHERKWQEKNPVPVVADNYCSGECPMYILSVPSSGRGARCGYPEAFDPASLVVTEQERDALLEFCRTHGIEVTGEPQWLLSSYWG